MLRFEWNALRTGDHVLVHDDADTELPLLDGVVTLVQQAAGSNDIAVRIVRAGTGPAIIRPRRRATHPSPVDPRDPCWRCDAVAAHRPLASSTTSS